MIIFRYPLFLGLILIIVPLAFFLIKGDHNPYKRNTGINYSDLEVLRGIKPTWRAGGAAVMPWFGIVALVLMVIGLARPQIGLRESLERRMGIDILLALDVSPSMSVADFKLHGKSSTRLEVVKAVAGKFIEKRPDDRIGIIIFSGQPYILAPLTWDHDWCRSRLDELQAGMIEEGTAIGSALASAVNRLRDSNAKSKVIILLTDGVNNAGPIMPETAAKAAKSLSIVVYTIGAGSEGGISAPVVEQPGGGNPQNVRPDVNLLKRIAEETGGRYFPATDTRMLEEIFQRINKMERSVSTMPRYQEYQDLYPVFLLLALAFLVAETILSNTVFRRIP